MNYLLRSCIVCPLLILPLLLPYSVLAGQSVLKQKLVLAGYGYIENKGQITDQNNQPNSAVRYLLNSPGLNIQLRANGFSYDSYCNESIVSRSEQPRSIVSLTRASQSQKLEEKGFLRYYHRVDVELVGANPSPRIISEGRSEDYLNYYTPGTGVAGVTDVHSYAKVIYVDIYPNIDLEFYLGKKGEAEYQFVVRPGGDIRQIHLQYNGANSTRLRGGKIRIAVAKGSVTEHIPKSFIQQSGKKIDVQYCRYAANEYGFAALNYPTHETLVIDPIPSLAWGTYYGGDSTDWSNDIAIDSTKNVLVTGITTSITGIATSGVYQTSRRFAGDAFVAKFDSYGVRMWGTYYGGTSAGMDVMYEEAFSVAADINGNVLICGTTLSLTGLSTSGAHQPGIGGGYDGFIAKFSSTGTRTWATYYGGSGNDWANRIVLDLGGNILITGYTNSTNNIASSGSYQPALTGGTDAFVAKFTDSGTRLWGTYYGGIGDEEGRGITGDAAGNILVAGVASSTSGITTGGAHQTLYGGGTHDGFLLKLSGNGTRIWCSYYGGLADDQANSVALDATGNIFLGGQTGSYTGIATPGAFQTVFGQGFYDAFIAKFNAAGTRLWATYYGSGAYDGITNGMAIDVNNNVVIAGITASADVIATSGTHQPTTGGGDDAFVAKFSNDGSRLWGTYYGGRRDEIGKSVVCEGVSNIYITGSTFSRNGIATNGAHRTTTDSLLKDGFIARLLDCAIPIPVIRPGASSAVCLGDVVQYEVTTINSGNTYQWQNLRIGDIISGNNSMLMVARWAQTGKDTVRLRETNPTTGCYKDTMFIVTVYPKPVAGAGTAKSVCSGESVQLNGTGSGGSGTLRYEWSPTDGLSSSTILTPVATPTVTTDYTLTVTDFRGCTATATVKITVNPKPIANAGQAQVVCTGSSGVKIGTPSAKGYSYSWTPTTGLSSGTTAQPVARPTITTIYKLVVTDDTSKCTDTSLVEVRVYQLSAQAAKSTIDFGAMGGCESSKDTVIEISNTGSDDITFTSQTSTSAGFIITDALPFTLAKGAKKNITIRFTPSVQGQSKGVLSLTGSPCNFELKLDVQGTKQQTTYSADKSAIAYGVSLACNAGVQIDSTIIIRNTSNEKIIISSAIITAPYSVVSPAFSQTIDAGALLPIVVRYTPTATGVFASELRLPYTIGSCLDTIRIPLTASHIMPEIGVDVSTLKFPDLIGCLATQDTTIHVRNENSIDVEITSISSGDAQFKVQTPVPFTLSPGASKDVVLRFAPSGNGNANAMLKITSNPCNREQTVQLSGSKQGVSFAVADTIDLGELVMCAQTSISKQVSIRNTSGGNVAGSVTNAASSNWFGLSLKAGDALPNGQDVMFTVTFTPDANTPTGETVGRLDLSLDPCGLSKTIYVKAKKTDVAASAESSIDFQQVPNGATRTQVVHIANTGSATMTITSIDGVTAPFSVGTTQPPLPATLQAGDTLKVEVLFTATSGTHSIILTARGTQPCVVSTTTTIRGEGGGSGSISSTPNLPFDSVCVGGNRSLMVTLKNEGGESIILQKAEWVTNPGNVFSTTLTSQSIGAGSSIQQAIDFSPTASAVVNGEVRWVTDKDTAYSKVSGIGKICGNGSDSAKVVIGIGDIEGAAGSKANLVLKIVQQTGMGGVGAPTKFRAKLRYNNTMLYNEQTSNACVNTDSDNGSCEIEVTGSRSSTSTDLASVPCILTLGNSDQSEIELREFTWTDGSVPIQTQTQNGKLQLTGVCEEGGVRLYISGKVSQSLTSRPIPAQNSLQVQYGLREALTVTLELISATGQVVQTMENNAARQSGQYTIMADISSVANGVYYLRLTTNKGILTSRVSVVK